MEVKDTHIDPDSTLTSTDIAQRVFRRSVNWWYKNRWKYHDKFGFPMPLTPDGIPIWSAAKVLHWVATWESQDGKTWRRKGK